MGAEKYFTAMPYPRSFLSLLIAALLLVALPLFGSLLYAAWQLERLTAETRSAIFGAAKAAQVSRALVSRSGSLERIAVRLAAGEDRGVRSDFERAHTGFLSLAHELERLALQDAQRKALQQAVAQERALVDLVGGSPSRPGKLREARDSALALADDAYLLLSVSNGVADRQVAGLGTSAEAVHNRLIMMLLIATALALAAALVLTRIIARPILALDAAIRQLGSADFERPIRVAGPEDLRNLGERLDWLRLRLTELEAQKNRFLRHLSHDLKTPLAALREGTELLNDQVAGPLAPPQRQVVAILRDNSVKLQRLIEDLLDYQRALHAATGLVPGQVELHELIRQTVRSHVLAAQAKSQRVSVEAGQVNVWADASKLRSIFDNLLGNAIKFTPPGGEIRVAAREQRGFATVDVIDSGPGVPPEERESIFEAFFRGRAGASGRAEGTGLGLAIAREFAEAHGGRIEAVAGARGGHFRVTLPQRPNARLAEAA